MFTIKLITCYLLFQGFNPGAITNALLQAQDSSDTSPPLLSTNLVEGFDFTLIPLTCFEQLQTIFGGGPAIPRQVVRHSDHCTIELRPLLVNVYAHTGGGGGGGQDDDDEIEVGSKETTRFVGTRLVSKYLEWSELQSTLTAEFAGSGEGAVCPQAWRLG